MKAILSTIHIIIISLCVNAQAIQGLAKPTDLAKVKLYFKFKCDGRIQEINQFTLASNTRYYQSTDSACLVPFTNRYTLYTDIENLDRNTIEVKSSNVSDTIIVYKVYKKLGGGIPPRFVYTDCGQVCNGEIVDYWDNGNRRIIGTFKNGNPIKMTQFFLNGAINHDFKKNWFCLQQSFYSEERLQLKQKKILFISYLKIWYPEKNKYIRKYYL